MKHVLLAAAALALASPAAAAPADDPHVGPHPVLPPLQQYLLPPMHLAKVVGWAQGATPKVAPGLKIEAYATGLQHPRNIYVLPNGDVLVVESKSPNVQPIRRPKDYVMGMVESWVTSGGDTGKSNRITLLRDSKGSGKPDLRTVFLDNLNSPFGVALVGGDLYVADTDEILKYPYKDGEAQMSAPGQPFLSLPGGPIDHHWTKSLVASLDGKKLYVGVGSNSNIVENGWEAEKDRARIWEVDRETGASRPYATGLRNPNGLTFDPSGKTLWAVINERDELGPDLVPDYMTSVKEGAFYGWPWSYWGPHVDPRVRPQNPEMVAKAIAPDYALGSHVAPLGMAFDTQDGLPSQYKGGAFVGEHGSWDRPQLSGYKVVFVPFANGVPNGPPQDVVTGFLNDQDQAQGRPVGVAFDKTGALLIADDVGNTVWRVTSAERQTNAAPVP